MVNELSGSSSNRNEINIILADDHPLMRQALRDVLLKHPDFNIVAEVNDGDEAVRLATELTPDVVIMDISMPVMDGLEATRQIKAKCPQVGVLTLTIYSDTEHILGMLQAGSAGYLTKSVYGEEVVHAIRALAAGETVLAPAVSRQVLKYACKNITRPAPSTTGETLTTKEMEILRLVAKGLSNKQIASMLNLSLRTVKGYLADIFLKLGVASRTEATIVCIRAGIITIDDIE
ncbi:MAG: response regulator [Dehalococcoidia bacterium]